MVSYAARPMLWSLVLFVCGSLTALGQDRVGPFTQPPRSVRSRDVDQQHVRLDLRFDWDRQQVDGRAELQLKAFRPITELQLDAADMTIERVSLRPGNEDEAERKSLEHSLQEDQLRITLDRAYDRGEQLTVVVEYRIEKPEHGVHFVVPDETEPDQPQMVWTQSEPEYARYWYPCVDTPADRLTSEILATVPADFMVLSNGVLKEKKEHDDGTCTWHWHQEQDHVPYLLSVVAGRFEAYEQTWRNLPVISYVPQGRLEQAQRSFEKTTRMLDYFSERLAYRYPWPKYTQICVDEYGWGGMEHTSATTLNINTLHDDRAHLDVSSDNLVAHELIHQWFGNLLTCKDWGEIWLNESFATYFANLWTEEDLGWDEATWDRYRDGLEYLEEDRKYRRPIVTYRYNSPEVMFDSHSYPKGGRVLHMLRFVLGEQAFWQAIQHYVRKNEFRVVETADLRQAIEESTGQGLNWFFDQWVYHGGHPEFEVSWEWQDDSKTAQVRVKQVQKRDEQTPLFRTPVEIELAVPSGPVIRRVEVSREEETFHFQLDERPRWVSFDPQEWILKELKVTQSREAWLEQLASDPHMMCRVRAAQALAEHTKETKVREALLRTAQQDGFWAVRQEAVKSLAKAEGDQVRSGLMQVLRTDEKSFVRREVAAALENFAHEETRAALRDAIASDRSYHTIAACLKSLCKLDPDSGPDLIAALEVDDHQEVILRAACEGILEQKHEPAVERLEQLLKGGLNPYRRVTLVGTLARLKPDDPDVREQLYRQLENDRPRVRIIALDALIELGDGDVIARLREQRAREETPFMIERLDQAIAKLRAKQQDIQKLQEELERLQQRLERLERKG